MSECRSVLVSARQTVVLAFDLVGGTAEDLPELARRALESKEVNEAIRKALDREARKLATEHPGAMAGEPVPVDGDRALKFARGIGEGALKAAGSHLASQVESSPEGRRLRQAAEQLVEDLKCSPAGAWVDRNKAILYVVGAVTAVGAGTALYLTRWGDPVGTLVADKALKFDLGTVRFEGKLTKFEPSSRTVGAEIRLSGPPGEPVKGGSGTPGQSQGASLTIAGLARDREVEASAAGEVLLPLPSALTGVLSLRFDHRNVLGGGPTGLDRPRLLNLSPALGLRLSDGGLKVDVLAGANVDLLSPGASPFAEGSLGYRRDFGSFRADLAAGLQLGSRVRVGSPGFERARPPAPLGTSAGLFKDERDAVFKVGATLTITFK